MQKEHILLESHSLSTENQDEIGVKFGKGPINHKMFISSTFVSNVTEFVLAKFQVHHARLKVETQGHFQFYIKLISFLFHICDMIKRNESDVGNVVFEILAKTVFKFLCFILFLAL